MYCHIFYDIRMFFLLPVIRDVTFFCWTGCRAEVHSTWPRGLGCSCLVTAGQSTDGFGPKRGKGQGGDERHLMISYDVWIDVR